MKVKLSSFLFSSILLIVFITLGCKPSFESTDLEAQKQFSLSGKAIYTNAEDNSSIYVTLDKTDGLRAAAVTNSRAIVAYLNCSEDGTFQFDNLEPGVYTVYASSPDSQEKAVSRNITIDEEDKVLLETLNLTATGSLCGKITLNSSESNNSGFTVYIGGTSYMAKTGSSGEFIIPSIPAGTDYEIFIEKGTFSFYWKNADVIAFKTNDLSEKNFTTEEIKKASLFTDGIDGKNGIDGTDGQDGEDGQDGTSIIWKGSFESETEIENPQKLWAYYNTTDGCSYIYDGTKWTLLTSKGDNGEKGQDGKDGVDGKNGTDGKNGVDGTDGQDGEDGQDGTSIIWKGSFESETEIENPQKLWAYFNTTDGCSYIYDGTEWTLLASKGTDGENGKDGKNGQDGISIIWKGIFESEAEIENPQKLWAYFNITDGCSYIYDGTKWVLLASKGADGDKVESYSITYILNGGTFESTPSFIHVYGETTQLQVPEREGYCFLGWYLNDNYSGNEITSLNADLKNDVTLYAKWKLGITVPGGVVGMEAFLATLNDTETSIIIITEEYPDLSIVGSALKNNKTKNVILDLSLTKVSSVKDENFKNAEGLIGIELPDTVTSIGASAFYNCNELTSITIPDSVTAIGASAFYNCNKLSSVTIPAFVKSIGNAAFCNCSELSSITILIQYGTIGVNAFRNCEKLKKVIIRDLKGWCCIDFNSPSSNPLYYAGHLYLNDEEITSLQIPDYITSIYPYAFINCKELSSVTIPCIIKSIGDRAFEGCENLKKVSISDLQGWCRIDFNSPSSNPLYYAGHLYLKDEEITSFQIPDNKYITSIRPYAFINCKGLSSITIPSYIVGNGKCRIEYIGDNAFEGCENLKKVNISNLKGWCFIDFKSPSSNPLYYAGHLYLNDEEITSLQIPDYITSIRPYAFINCKGFSSVTIPYDIESIGDSAFEGCENLKKVNISDLRAWYRIDFKSPSSNPLYYAGHIYFNDKEITTLKFPSDITLKSYAFINCKGLTSVIITNILHIEPFALACGNNVRIFSEVGGYWYITENKTDYDNRKNGKEIKIYSSDNLIEEFNSTYSNYYWYRY